VKGAGHGVPPSTAASMPAWFNEHSDPQRSHRSG
jgi:hypothetical protein